MSPEAFKKIIVAVDGSESSKKAALVAVDMAEKYSAEIVVLHVTTWQRNLRLLENHQHAISFRQGSRRALGSIEEPKTLRVIE